MDRDRGSPGIRRTFPPTRDAIIGVLKASAARWNSGIYRKDGWIAIDGGDLVAAFREDRLDELCAKLQELHKNEEIIADGTFIDRDFLEEVDSPDFSPSRYDTDSTWLGSFDYLIQGPRQKLKDVATHLRRIGFNEIEQVLMELFDDHRRKEVEEDELRDILGLTERKGVGVWWVPDLIYGNRGRIDAPPTKNASCLFRKLLEKMKKQGRVQPVAGDSIAPSEYARFRDYGVLRVLRSLPGPDADEASGPTHVEKVTDLSKSAAYQNLQTLVGVCLVKRTDSGYRREPVSLRGCVLLELEEELLRSPESGMRVDKALALLDDHQATERSKEEEDPAEDDDVIERLGHLDDATLLAVLDELRAHGYLEFASAPEGTHPRIPAPDDPQSLIPDWRIRPTPRALALLGRCTVCREFIQEGIAVRMGDRSSPYLSFPLHETCAGSIPEDEEERRRFTWPTYDTWCNDCDRYLYYDLHLTNSVEMVEIEREGPPGQRPSSRDMAGNRFGSLPRWVHKECPRPPRDADR